MSENAGLPAHVDRVLHTLGTSQIHVCLVISC